MGYDQAAMQYGRDWEVDFAKKLGAELVQGSGNQWHAKLDVDGTGITWSLKSTLRGESYEMTGEEMDEAVLACRAIGGPGTIPGMAFRIQGYDIVAMRASDLLVVLSQPAEYGVPESKAEARRRRAMTPSARRSEDA